MKNKKLFVINAILLAFLIAAAEISTDILDKNGFIITNLTLSIILITAAVLSVGIVIQLIQALCNVYKNNKSNAKKALSVIAVILIAISVCGVGYLSLFGYAFGYEPEHIVEKDGRKMVACVNSFLQVIVNYYDYENPFVRGKQVRRYEDYGNGGYDPFNSDEELTPCRYTVYDENGNVIETYGEN